MNEKEKIIEVPSKCIYCQKRFLCRKKLNKQGKPVRIKGESARFCSEACHRKFKNDYLRDLRQGNEYYMEYNRKRMSKIRYEKYKRRAQPLYNELKALVKSNEDEAAIELLTDISIGRIKIKEDLNGRERE